MATEAQIEANRANAQKSTGPRTLEGKTAIARNAVKHGLRARAAVLQGEDWEEYTCFREEMLEELYPDGMQEMELATRIVDLTWRLRRAGRYQDAALRRSMTSMPPNRRRRAPVRTWARRSPAIRCWGGCSWRTSRGSGSWSGCCCTSGGSRAACPGPGPICGNCAANLGWPPQEGQPRARGGGKIPADRTTRRLRRAPISPGKRPTRSSRPRSLCAKQSQFQKQSQA
jgi:hypothetical protein